MKFSEDTLVVLKNFASINSGLVLNKGNVQRTISSEKSVLAEATLEESIPFQLGIYDFNQFLGNVSALGDAELTFYDNRIVMSDGEIELNYYSSPTSNIISPPDKELKMKKVDASFVLTNNVLQKFLRLAAMNNFSNISLIGKDGEIRLHTHIKNVDTSNYASIKLNDYSGEDFAATFKVENIKLLPADYDVEIEFGAFAKFTCRSGIFKDKIRYFIALEAK